MNHRFAGIAALAMFATVPHAGAGAASMVAGTRDAVRDLGPAPANVSVRVAIVLAYHHQRELDELTIAQAEPGSATYHRFLTPYQFRSYFAPTAIEYATVVRSLERGGFTIVGTTPNRSVIDAVAPAPVASRYFATSIHRVLSADRRVTYANVQAPSAPLEITHLVKAVIGLDDTGVFRVPHRIVHSTSAPGAHLPRRDGSPLFGPAGGYGPQIFTAAYDLPSAQGYTGTGRTAGVDMAGDFSDSDLAGFLAYFGVTRTGPPITRVAVDGGAPPFPAGDADETAGDVETIASLAPGAAIDVYEYPALHEPYFTDMYNRVVSDDLVDTLSSSWYGCERQDHGQFAAGLEAIAEQGAAEGITFHSITGDRGIYVAPCKAMSVAVPGSTPHNIAVGGTELFVDANGNETNEVGWDVPGNNATGGGVSVEFKRPSYQDNVPNVIKRGRNVPDVAFDAGCNTPEAYYFEGAWSVFCGTSLSSPIFGAALIELDQLVGERAGYFNVTLYQTWLADGYARGSTTFVRDITQGSIPPYYAQAGYDQMTGIGALQVTNFAGLLP